MGSKQIVHVVGGGINQVPLVEKVKARGYEVLVTDIYQDPPCRKLADYFESIDTTDKHATLRAAEAHRVSYVMTDMTDVAVPTVAYVAEKLGLPGIGLDTAIRFTNKFAMRRAIQDGGLAAHIPEFHYFENVADALSFLRDAPSKLTFVVKPINSQGSKGVNLVAKGREEELVTRAFQESMERGVLIERYIGGFEYSAECFVRDGHVHNLTLTKKYHYADNPCLDERNTYLGDVDPQLERQIFEVNAKIIAALGLPFGNTHAEYKVEGGRIYLMEIAARGAGGMIAGKIIPYLTGFDCLGALVDVLTGRATDIVIEDYRRRYAVLKFFNFAPGRVKRVLVNERVTRDLMMFTLDLHPGQEIVRPKDSRDRPGYFIVHGEDRNGVLERERLVEEAVQVEYQ